MLAHEIRNVLHPLRTAADLLEAAGVDDATSERAKAIVGRQVRRLVRLVDDLLDIRRLQCGQLKLVLETVDLSELVSTLCEDHRDIFASRGISLASMVPTVPVTCRADPDRLAQVLTNLLNNSWKFTDPGGSVHVSLSLDEQADTAVIAVRDTGIGIDADMIQVLFEPYAHQSSSRNRAGLGLGLPLVQRLVELHGGHLEVSSGGPGAGSEFRVVLPLGM